MLWENATDCVARILTLCFSILRALIEEYFFVIKILLMVTSEQHKNRLHALEQYRSVQAVHVQLQDICMYTLFSQEHIRLGHALV